MAGLIVTTFIVHVGWEITSDLVAQLMDSVDPDVLARAEAAALTVPDVAHLHVRARWMGRSLVVDIEGFVGPQTTVDAAEALGRRVQGAVIHAVPETRTVLWSPHALPAP